MSLHWQAFQFNSFCYWAFLNILSAPLPINHRLRVWRETCFAYFFFPSGVVPGVVISPLFGRLSLKLRFNLKCGHRRYTKYLWLYFTFVRKLLIWPLFCLVPGCAGFDSPVLLWSPPTWAALGWASWVPVRTLWKPEEGGSSRLGLQESPGGLDSLEESVAAAGLRGLALFQGHCLWWTVLSWLEYGPRLPEVHQT